MKKKVSGFLMAILTVAAAIPVFATDVTVPDPVIYYNFDNPDFVGADVTGNGHNAAVLGDITLSEGVFGSAGYFNGEDTALRGGADIEAEKLTITCWVKPDDITDYLYSFFTCDDWNAGAFHMHMNSDQYIAFGVADASFDVTSGQNEYLVEEWNFIAAVIDAAEGSCYMYLNGEYDTDGISAPFSNILLNAFSVGCWTSGNFGERWVKGYIDDVRIYTEALTEEQVIAVMEGAGVISGMGATTGEQTIAEVPTYPISGIEANGVLMVGELLGTPGWNNMDDYAADKAMDASVASAFCPMDDGNETWVGVKMDEPYTLTQVNMMPRSGFVERCEGAMIQGSNDGTEWTTLYTLEGVVDGEWLVITDLDTSAAYTQFRYTSPDQPSDVAEIEFYGTPVSASVPAETETVETAAPETAVPETDETPETETPETEAPAVEPAETVPAEPETEPAEIESEAAPQTGDAMIVLATAVLLLGFAVRKKVLGR